MGKSHWFLRLYKFNYQNDVENYVLIYNVDSNSQLAFSLYVICDYILMKLYVEKLYIAVLSWVKGLLHILCSHQYMVLEN